jgi:hypothetical protein
MTVMVALQERLDLYAERAQFFRARRIPEYIDLPEASYLIAEGQGEPGGPTFQRQVSALFSVAYTVKMAAKKASHDFKVPTFEGSWWVEGASGALPRDQWRWQLLLMLPDFVEQEDVSEAKTQLARRKAAVDTSGVRLEKLTQGPCVQILHLGPYDTEDSSIQKMLNYMVANNLEACGPHHEVYLSDPNRCKPEALRTILRQRVQVRG